jgi:hypothetical protein
MTTRIQLQQHLRETGRYTDVIDGDWGPKTQDAVIKLFEDGPDTPLSEQDFIDSAKRLGVTPAHIKAVCAVEANGSGFSAGKPLILPEPHRFSRATGHRYDRAYPQISYPSWGMRPYPKTQDDRYAVLLKMISLDVDAGFGSASYGKFQIMGENFAACGFANSMLFADACSRDEKTQLAAFEKFITNGGLVSKLRAGDWAGFAKGYNGSAYAKNQYDTKLHNAYVKFGGR